MLNTMERELFRDRLKRLRKAARKSQRQVARDIGMSNGTISQAERGALWVDQLPSHDIMRRLATSLGVKIDELAGEETSSSPQVAEGRAAYDDEMAAFAELGREIMSIVNQRRNIRPGPRIRVFDVRRLPVVNGLSASELASDARQVEQWITVSAEQLAGATDPVAYIINGDCLWDRWGIKTGDTLIVDAGNKEPRDGQVVAARINDTDETAKEFHRVPGGIDLRPTSPGYDAIPIRGNDQLVIIGVYVTHLPTGKR